MATSSTGKDTDPSRGHQLIFVCGLHRSGTTPLANALAQHPQVSGLIGTGLKENEGQHVQAVYPSANTHGGAGRFALHDDAHLTEQSDLATADNARRLWEAWTPYWDLDREYLLEKSPPNVMMTRLLQKFYPNASFVVVVRHPVVVALSTKKWRRLLNTRWRRIATFRWWNYASLSSMVGHWVRAYDTLAADSGHLQRVVLVRYEDLVTDPDRELGRIQRFLGLSSAIPAGSLSGSHSTRYEDTWQAMRIGSWRQRRSVHDIVNRYAGDIARWGYDVQDLRVNRPFTPVVTTSNCRDGAIGSHSNPLNEGRGGRACDRD